PDELVQHVLLEKLPLVVVQGAPGAHLDLLEVRFRQTVPFDLQDRNPVDDADLLRRHRRGRRALRRRLGRRRLRRWGGGWRRLRGPRVAVGTGGRGDGGGQEDRGVERVEVAGDDDGCSVYGGGL